MGDRAYYTEGDWPHRNNWYCNKFLHSIEYLEENCRNILKILNLFINELTLGYRIKSSIISTNIRQYNKNNNGKLLEYHEYYYIDYYHRNSYYNYAMKKRELKKSRKKTKNKSDEYYFDQLGIKYES